MSFFSRKCRFPRPSLVAAIFPHTKWLPKITDYRDTAALILNECCNSKIGCINISGKQSVWWNFMPFWNYFRVIACRFPHYFYCLIRWTLFSTENAWHYCSGFFIPEFSAVNKYVHMLSFQKLLSNTRKIKTALSYPRRYCIVLLIVLSYPEHYCIVLLIVLSYPEHYRIVLLIVLSYPEHYCIVLLIVLSYPEHYCIVLDLKGILF